MIPKQENVAVFSNSKNEKAFTINASREAFRILSSGLYSNKPQAIIRELSCNAYDAHVMAGTPDRPFKVHLPDEWEPFLSIEDFGIGLDDDDINTIYTSYFTSTKTTSNDVIGGLGLGSKTPFSYTDTFTIRARKDSVERIYNAYISDAGSPTVSLMSESDTDEPNGVLITVPIQRQDFYNFRQEAKTVFKYFRVLPEINETLNNDPVKQLDENHGLIVHTNAYNSGNVTVVMGNVAYHNKITDTLIPKDKVGVWKFLDKSSMIIRFNIGDLSVAASREMIAFDEESKQFFIEKIESIVDDYYAAFQVEVDKCATVHEALDYISSKLADWGWPLFTYGGETLDVLANKNVMQDVIDVIEEIDPDLSLDPNAKILRRRYGGPQLQVDVLKSKHDVYRIRNKEMPGRKIAFMSDDTDHGRGLEQNSRAYIRANQIDTLIVLKKELTEDQVNKLQDILGSSFFDYRVLTSVKEEFKIVKEKKQKESGAKKDPVVRAKKNEIRIAFWDMENPCYGSELNTSSLIDIEEIKDKRIGLLEVSRGETESCAFGMYRDLSTTNMVLLCKVYGLDGIVITRPSQTLWAKEKMPFVLDIAEMEDEPCQDKDYDLLNTYVAGYNIPFYQFIEYYAEKDNFEDSVESRVVEKTSSNYRGNLVYHMINPIKELDIPEIRISGYTTALFNRLENAISSLTPEQIHVMKAPAQSIYDSKSFKLLNAYSEMVSRVRYKETEEIAEKYPLLKLLYNDLDNEDTIANVNEYISMINEKALEKELYQKAA